MTSIVRDSSIVLSRELRPLARDPFSVVFTMVQPLVFLALFGPLLHQVTGLPTGSSLQWFVPGIIVMSALFGSSTSGSYLQADMKTGSHERILVTPLGRSSLLVGRALREVVPVLGQAVVIVAVTVPFGFRIHLAGALVALVVLAAFAVGLGSLSHALALAAKDNELMFWMVQQSLLFPLLLLSGMLLPIAGGPGWMQALSDLNPLTHVVNAQRVLFEGHIADAAVLRGAIAAAGVLVVGVNVGIRAMRRSPA